MTRQEYSDYEASVADFMRREGLDNLTSTSEEPFFSWANCECCGQAPGGNREEAIGWNPTARKIQRYDSICQDCIYYAEYGQLDDQTMLTLEEPS